MTTVTIYHNPRCSKSRETLKLLESKGISPVVVEYLDTPPKAEELKTIIKQLDITPRELLRKNEDEYKTLNLKDETLTDAELIKAMCKHPKLIQRPIVAKGKNARLGRPPELVLEIL